MAKYGLAGKIITDAENRDALLAILCDAANLMENAEGCQVYIVSKIVDDDTAIWITELWDSKESHDKSLSVAGVGDLIAKARPMIRGMEQVVHTPISGKGL